MEISIEELNALLEKEFQRGKESSNIWNIKTYNTTPVKTFTTDIIYDTYSKNDKNSGNGICNCALGMTDIIY